MENILNDPKVKVARGGDQGTSCLINGISIGDCSNVNVGDILNGGHANAAGGSQDNQSCDISGISILVSLTSLFHIAIFDFAV